MVRALYLMPTHQCNGACTYCYLPERKKDGEARMFERVVDRFVADMADEPGEALQLRFIGGEPCLRPDLMVRLTERFLTGLPGSTVRVNSNGTLVDDDLAGRLKPFADRVAFIVSMDGLPAIHNARRKLKNGDDAHAAAVRGIDALQRAGVAVYLNVVLDAFSMPGLGELMTYIRERFGMTELGISLLDSPRHPMTPADKLQLLQQAYAIAAEHDMRLSGHHRLLLGDRIPGLKCGAGRQTILVAANGELAACQRFVGKSHTPPPIFDDSVDFRTVQARECSACCYTDDVRQLAQGLEELYESRYPGYRAVSDLDRVLFGVI